MFDDGYNVCKTGCATPWFLMFPQTWFPRDSGRSMYVVSHENLIAMWVWVKTLVPSEPQNSWDLWMFIHVHPTKNGWLYRSYPCQFISSYFHLVLWSMKEERLQKTRSGWVWSWPCHPHRCSNNTSFPMLEHHQLRRSVGDAGGNSWWFGGEDGDPMGSPSHHLWTNAASYPAWWTNSLQWKMAQSK